MTYKNYGENLRPAGGVEVFFPNFLRLIRLIDLVSKFPAFHSSAAVAYQCITGIFWNSDFYF